MRPIKHSKGFWCAAVMLACPNVPPTWMSLPYGRGLCTIRGRLVSQLDRNGPVPVKSRPAWTSWEGRWCGAHVRVYPPSGVVPRTAQATATYERGPSASPSKYADRTAFWSLVRSASLSVAKYSAPGPSFPVYGSQ
jgi:hypothetical protein